MPLLSIKDIHDLIEQDVHNLGFYTYDDLETEEIDLQINRQIYKLVDGILDKYFGRLPKVGTEIGFQKDQVTLDNLRQLHIKSTGISVTVVNTTDWKFDFPVGYYHAIKGAALVSYTCKENDVEVTKTINVKLRISESKDIENMKNHPFYKTNKKSPLAEIINNSLYIIGNGTFTVVSCTLDYIRKPAKVVYGKDINGAYDSGTSVQCDLDDSLHYLLQEMTTLRILKILENTQQKIENIQQETI